VPEVPSGLLDLGSSMGAPFHLTPRRSGGNEGCGRVAVLGPLRQLQEPFVLNGAVSGHVKSERCKDQLSVRVVAVAQNAAKTSLNVVRQVPLEVGVGSYDLRNLSHHGREVP
jgi:hypothetical protein